MRPGITWAIVGALAVIVVFAGLDVLRSAGDEPTPSAAASATAVTTTRTEPDRSTAREVERTGNSWARLFGAGRTCNQFMVQPACERVACERLSGELIENCTRVSPKVQRSFAAAGVQDIVIRGIWAAARFSNGETVLFREVGISGSWAIVGSGQAASSSSSDAHRTRQRPALAAKVTCRSR
jgi:hypothetical protein